MYDILIHAEDWFFNTVPSQYQPLILIALAALLTWRAGAYLASNERGSLVKGLTVLPFAAMTFIYGLLLLGLD